MKYRLLGKSGLRSSELALGTMAYGGAQYNFTDNPVSKTKASKVIQHAIDQEINHIDCADIYGAYGNAERIIGSTISDYEREELILTSKVMMPMSAHEMERGLGRKHLLKSINRTLKNLKTDYIDLYYAHRYDYFTPLEETIRTMNMLIDNGKIRYWGTSNWSPAELERTVAICEKYGFDAPIVDQTKYNLLQRYAGEFVLQYTLDNHGIGLVAYKILLNGIFTGIHTSKDFSKLNESELKALNTIINFRPFSKTLYEQLQQFGQIASDLDLSPSQLAYAWTFQVQNLSVAIMSTRNPDRIDENVKACEINLNDETVTQINQLFPNSTTDYTAYNMYASQKDVRVIGKIPDTMLKF